MHRLQEREMSLFKGMERGTCQSGIETCDHSHSGIIRLSKRGFEGSVRVTTVVLHQGQPAVPNQILEMNFGYRLISGVDTLEMEVSGKGEYDLGSPLQKSRDKFIIT